jgi:hypothetical protein
MKALQQLASRVFVSAVRECARSYPQAFLEAVLVPLLRSSTLSTLVLNCFLFPHHSAFFRSSCLLTFNGSVVLYVVRFSPGRIVEDNSF